MQATSQPPDDSRSGAALAAMLVACGYLAWVLLRYGALVGYIKHGEPNVAITSWLLEQGRSPYPDVGETVFFANYYGPLIYQIHGAVFAALGATVPVSKLAGSLATAAAVGLFLAHAWRRYGTLAAFWGTFLFVAFLFAYLPFSIWNRPDPFIVFLVTAAVAAGGVGRRRTGPWTPHLVLGACMGLAFGLKVHSPIYFLPVVVQLCGLTGVRAMAVTAGAALVFALAPFAHPQVSLIEYAAAMSAWVPGLGFDMAVFAWSVRYAAYLVAPSLCLGILARRRKVALDGGDRLYVAAFALTVLVALYPASVEGAGPYHLMPLVPVAVDAMLRFARAMSAAAVPPRRALAALAAVFIVLGLPAQWRMIRDMDRLAGEGAAGEVLDVARRLGPKSVQMGYGETLERYPLTFYKALLAFDGQPVTVDGAALMDIRVPGFAMLDDLIAGFRSCRVRHWLIPGGERPFRMPSYAGDKDLFGAAGEVFEGRYALSASLTYYDLWSCAD